MATEMMMDSSDLATSDSPKHKQPTAPRSWDMLRHDIKQKRKLLLTLASRVPSSFTFRTVDTQHGPHTRLYFLGIPQNCRENTLLYVDIPKSTTEIVPGLQWKNLLDSFQASLSNGQLSREEQLLRERKRLGTYGVTSYDMSDGKFVFPACNSLFSCIDSNVLSEETVLPLFINTSTTGARLDPKLCPKNTDLVAFVHCNDIWVTNTVTHQECRLTFAHKGLSSLAADPMTAGVPSFVVQEEFDRYTGYWWEPDTKKTNHYRILYEEVDESEVEILSIFSPSDVKGVDEYRYPRAGTINARSSLKLVEFVVGEDDQIQDNIIEKQLYEPLCTFFPWMEYIVRAGWTPDCKYVYAQLMNRPQMRLSLILIPMECFIPVAMDTDVEMSDYDYNMNYPPLQVIYEDFSDVWVNVHDNLHFLPTQSSSEVVFVWSTEKSGYRHLYKVTSKLKNCDNYKSALDLIEDVLEPDIIEETPLTSGDWEVINKQIWVDTDKKVVYFIGLKDSVLETHLYSVAYDNPKNVVRLTEEGFSHNITISSDCSYFVTVYSSIQQTSMSKIFRLCHGRRGIVYTETLGTLMLSTACPEYQAPKLFNFDSTCGYKLHGLYYEPYGCEPGEKRPTVVMVYGGPQVQQVTNAFKGVRFLRHHTLATHGYTVVVIDGRGSCHRGLKYESYIKHKLGTVELDDQIEGLRYLASIVDFIDLDRVAIHGWSYGGYLSLLGLAKHPNVFKVAIAGAPVVSWNLYDTGYTERYMNIPEQEDENYRDSSILTYVDRFPDIENRLLIIHGLIDENVHFHHTSTLVNALIKACKPYQLQIYPNERHGIRNHEASEHYKTMILSFLQNNL
ncbi:dipeptidyl peptidase 9-like isoform X1 [Mytilus trossulus]|uniref:dipeptidyl peptidase 9-like isoform X1 n=1 Tax=Mytilus trossulus TaxID=6551 RepID=UPI003005A385